jgi:DNA-binding MarR family transcriptional regulator
MPRAKNIRAIPCHCINTRRAANAITAYYDQILLPCALSVSQFSLLWTLDGLGQSNVTRLAEYVGLERSTVVRNLNPLRKGEFVADLAGGKRRERELVVTAKGKSAISLGVPLWKQAQKDIYVLIGPENLAVFREVLQRLQQL